MAHEFESFAAMKATVGVKVVSLRQEQMPARLKEAA